MGSTWQTVPNIVDGVSRFCAADLNPIIQALTARTDELKQTVDAGSGNRGYIVPITGVSSSCSVGDFVYFDPEESVYKPAKADWANKAGVRADGSIIPNASTDVLGVLISKDFTGTGNTAATGMLMCAGVITDYSIISKITNGAQSGNYYLSSETPGKVEFSADLTKNISVLCCVYANTETGGRLYINPQAPDYGGHSHACVELSGTWDMSDLEDFSAFPGNSVPAGDATDSPVYVLDVTDNPEVMSLLAASPSSSILTHNGVVRRAATWGIVTKDVDGVTHTYVMIRFTIVGGDVFTLFATAPLLQAESIVRTLDIDAKTKFIKLYNTYGNVKLYTDFTPTSADAYRGSAVLALTNNELVKGPVVQKITAGPGVIIEPYSDNGVVVPGVHRISASSFVGTWLDTNLTNLNGAYLGTSGNETAYVFPSGTSTSLSGTVRIPHFAGVLGAEIICVFKGGTTGSIDITYTKQEMPTGSEAVMLGTPITVRDQTIGTGTSNTCVSSVIDIGEVKTDTLLTITVQANSPTDALTMLSLSARLKLINS